MYKNSSNNNTSMINTLIVTITSIITLIIIMMKWLFSLLEERRPGQASDSKLNFTRSQAPQLWTWEPEGGKEGGRGGGGSGSLQGLGLRDLGAA